MRRHDNPWWGAAGVKRPLARLVLFVAAVLLVASIVQSYAAGPAFRLVNPAPSPTTTTSKEVTSP
jgi:hypothetical protein